MIPENELPWKIVTTYINRKEKEYEKQYKEYLYAGLTGHLESVMSHIFEDLYLYHREAYEMVKKNLE